MKNNSEVRIPKEIATNVFALAAHLYEQEKQDYSIDELIQAGAEVHIPPELIQKAIQQIQTQQSSVRSRQEKLKLILISGSTGAAIALLSVFAYNSVASNFIGTQRSPVNNLLATDLRNTNTQDIPNPLQPPPPVFPKADETTMTGVVQQYLLNPEGKVDGLLLKNGLQVKFPPHMGDSLVALVTQGTKITISGKAGLSTRFGEEVKARSITNSQTGQTLVVQPPTIPPQPPGLSNYSTLSVEGTAQHWLVGHRGEINGVIVSNGAIVKLPPHVGNQLVNTANVGDKIQAQGFGTRNKEGEIIQATALSINGQAVSLEPKGVVEP